MLRRALTIVAILGVGSSSASADPTVCQTQIIKNLLKYKKTYLKKVGKCLDNHNLGKITVDCPDAATQLKIQTVATKIQTKLDVACSGADLATLGFSTCDFEPGATGVEGTCAAMPVTTGGELAACLTCWKGAELAEFIAGLYASHASQICGGALDETSPVCSNLGCTTPLPNQLDLGDTGENDCQKAIGKAGIKHLVSIEKVLEKCGLLGHDRTTCLADSVVQLGIQKSQTKLDTLIHNKCGNNRDPIPDPPFCCKTAPPQVCVAAASRTDCTDNLAGTVVENKTCVAGSCDAGMGGNQHITWWSTCPVNASCTGTLDTIDELIDCVDTMAHQATDELLCIQFATGWACPADDGSPSQAFLD
jgi:hypothetical protein